MNFLLPCLRSARPRYLFVSRRRLSIPLPKPSAGPIRPRSTMVTIRTTSMPPPRPAPRDPNTFSNYHEYVTSSIHAQLTIDFEKKVLHGHVELVLDSLTQGESREIVLDSSHVHVTAVEVNGEKAQWEMQPRTEPFGSKMIVHLGRGYPKGSEMHLTTTDRCTALQWLTPAMTSNKKHPYMFSQCQAIHARSIFPCQDTPDVKSKVYFSLASPLPVLASGLLTGSTLDAPRRGGGPLLYTFEQTIPIPSYLFAIASGDIASAPIGPRSTVWTGPEELQGAKWELERDTEKFIQAAEKLVYPYAWTTYNVLVLPPSFPYGGMENPVYTFATPTIISGDRENVDVIAHELAHSWSGNLVSAASWEHFWLNEGWTVYLERRIIAAIHGEPHRSFSALIGYQALSESIAQFGPTHEFTKLVPSLENTDPDDSFSSIPYEKGFTFLYYLETLLGQETWDPFIPHYFTTFRTRSLTTSDFLTTLFSFFTTNPEASGKLHTVDFNAWFYAPGFPPVKPQYDTSLVDVCYALAARWSSSADSDAKTSPSSRFVPQASDIAALTANQIVVFLETVANFKSPLGATLASEMDRVYRFGERKNVEIVSRWFQIGLKNRYAGVEGGVVELLGRVGRMKFVRPLYRELNKFDRAAAVGCFERNRGFYHPICRGMVEKDLFGGKNASISP